MLKWSRLLLAFLFCAPFFTCTTPQTVKKSLRSPEELERMQPGALQNLAEKSPYLKAHLHNGRVYVLSGWQLAAADHQVAGTGVLLGANRDTLESGTFTIPIDSVAIFETNVLKTSSIAATVTVLMGITAAVTVMCLTNPKTCFGSCPTFYLSDDDGKQRLSAEGFSASIAPSLEAVDIDDLGITRRGGSPVAIEMRNEALETHVVRYADLLAAPLSGDGPVLHEPNGAFWQLGPPLALLSAAGPEGDCLSRLAAVDDIERYSFADSTDLAAKETLEVTFAAAPPGRLGLFIRCRQTLLSTYLLYQTFAYMGTQAGYWFAQIERRGRAARQNGLQNILGGIEILQADDTGSWQVVGRVDEHGPLALDTHLIPLAAHPGKATHIRLRMTRGNWRIDQIGLAPLKNRVIPLRILPGEVLNNGFADSTALEILIDRQRALTTFPGANYTLFYRLPDDGRRYHIFLESRGYYLEWMRREWLVEENPALLAQMLMSPGAALKRLAPAFKKIEPQMEELFWKSKYARP